MLRHIIAWLVFAEIPQNFLYYVELLMAKIDVYICPDLIKGASPDPSLKTDEVGLQANSVREFWRGALYSSAEPDSSDPDLDTLGSTGSDGAILSG